MMSPLLVALLVAGGVFILKITLSRTQRKPSFSGGYPSRNGKSISGTRDHSSAFMAVSIDPCEQACRAARSLEGQRFLVVDAPVTPLNDCGSTKCRCRYVRFPDRRLGEDRRDPLSMEWKFRQLHGEGDRRRKRWGRRAQDMEPDFDSLVQHVRFS
jgi:hypothetical protein